MARPTRHPRTGVYWYRQRVPEDVRKLVGRREVTRTLGTKNLAEAKVAHARVAEEYALQWANLRLGQQTQTHKSIQALAGEFYREFVAARDEEPGPARDLARMLESDEFAIRASARRPGALFAQFSDDAREFLSKRGLVLSIADQARFVTAISRARAQAVAHTLAKAEGDYRPDPDAVRFPPPSLPNGASARGTKEEKPFPVYWDKYVTGRELAEKSVRRFHPIMLRLMAFLGKDDIAAVTEDDLIRWRDHLEENPKLTPKSIKNGQLAAAKAFFGWAHFKQHIEYNPSLKVHVDAGKKKVKMRGFTDEEAILSATLAQPSRLITPEHAAARRWVPWICAYTGARVNEVTQLRKSDIVINKACWAIVITPDAGTVKDRQTRYVPLHSHLIEQGFVEYVKERPDGPIFYSEKRKRNEGGRPQYETMGAKLAEWVRDLGVSDPQVFPNHGWRHRVKTLRRRYGMDKEITDAIQGHAPLTEGDGYGETELSAMYREISKIPKYDVVAMRTTDRRRKETPEAAGAKQR